METIKGLIDLNTKLTSQVKDRKVVEKLNKIQGLILQVQSEQIQLSERNKTLDDEKNELNKKVKELAAEIVNLNSSTTSAKGAPACPNCSTPSKPYLMTPLNSSFARVLNATYRCSKCDYRY